MKKLVAILAMVVAMGAVTSALAQQHVGLSGSGTWKSDWIYGGNVAAWSPRNVWVDAWVHNLGFNKEVGMLWTDNGWYTAHWAPMKYELTYADGAERWGVDVAPIGQFEWHRGGSHGWVELGGYRQTIVNNGKQIEYVLYYNDVSNGRMFWDNNGGQNYRIWVVKPGPNGYVE